MTHTVRTRARKGEGDKLRGEILAAAEELLIETADASAVSIRAIADRVGVTPPSIYRHFTDKEELLGEVCLVVFARLDEATEAAAAGATDPFDELMRKGLAYVEFGLKHPEHYRLVFMRPDVHETTGNAAHGRAIFGLDGATIMEGNAFGHLLESVDRLLEFVPERAGRPDRLAIAIGIWTSVHGITSLRIAKPLLPWPPIEEQLALMASAWVAYLCPETHAPGASEKAPPKR